MPPDLRTLRYSSRLPISSIESMSFLIVGCGAYGFSFARLLAQSFTPFRITLIDFDTVSAENYGPQGFSPYSLGSLKVLAAQEELLGINPSLEGHRIRTLPTSFAEAAPDLAETPSIIISASDSMACRSEVLSYFESSCPTSWLFDNRMAQEFFDLYALPFDRIPEYRSTLFPDSSAYQSPCTDRSTSYCAMAAASMTLSLITRLARTHPIPFKTHLDLLSSTLLISE